MKKMCDAVYNISLICNYSELLVCIKSYALLQNALNSVVLLNYLYCPVNVLC